MAPRAPRFAPAGVDLERRADGSIVLGSPQALGPTARALGEWLVQWAARAPDRTFLAERAGDGWRKLTYREVLEAARRVGQALLDRGLGPERPVTILSDNGVDHALPRARRDARRRAGRAGVARLLADVEGLREAASRSSSCCGPASCTARTRPVSPRRSPRSARPPRRSQRCSMRRRRARVDEAFARHRTRHRREDPLHLRLDRHAQGRRSTPTACCARTSRWLAQVWPFLEDRPPVIVDWLPWNHTFGGNYYFNLVLRNGGTLYIDGGKPAPGLIETTRAT